MPPVRRSKLASKSFRHNPISHQSNQVAEPDTGTKVDSMSWPQYVALGKTLFGMDCSTQKQRGVCEHYRGYEKFGGIQAFNNLLVELDIDTSSLVKSGMPPKGGCNDYTVLPLNDFGREMAERVNKMTRDIEDSNTRKGSSLYRQFSHVRRFIKDLPELFSEDSVLSKTLQAVKGNTTWLAIAVQAMRGYKTPTVFIAFVIAVGGWLWRSRRRGRRNVLNPGGTEDDDDDDGDVVDGPKTDSSDDGDNNGDNDSEQPDYIMCRVTLNELSDAYRTAKAPPRWEWGHFRPCGQNMQVTPDGTVRYQVWLPLMKEVGWFKVDQIEFPDGETFNGHDLRKRVKGQGRSG